LVPSFDGGDDLARVFCPDKWLWVDIGIGDEAVDCAREFLERTKHAALEAPLGEEREQTFDSIEPGCRGRGEVEDKARVASEPFQDLGMLVREISAVSCPAAVSRAMLACQTCFCGLFRLAITAFNAAESAALSLIWVLSCIPQTRMTESAGESARESKSQIWSTR
jgi:hypothetical protein